jgi:hypothetical protein
MKNLSVTDLMLPVGFIVLSYGCWLAWHPLGFIVGGACIMSAAVFIERGKVQKRGNR